MLLLHIYTSASSYFYKILVKLIHKIVINQFRIGPVTGPRSPPLLAHTLRPLANTANLGPVTGPTRNYLINNIITANERSIPVNFVRRAVSPSTAMVFELLATALGISIPVILRQNVIYFDVENSSKDSL